MEKVTGSSLPKTEQEACHLATWGLREVERACDRAADKRRVSFPDLHNIYWKPTVNRTLQCHQSTSDHFLDENAIVVGILI